MEKGKGFSLKDQLFNPEKIGILAGWLQPAVPGFDRDGFESLVLSKLSSLELKQRISWIADCLAHVLDEDFENAADQIANALPPPLDPSKTDDDFGDFIIAPFGEYVAGHGCTKKHLDRSLELIEALTQRFSMEYAMRFFINTFPTESFARLESWASHENYHVRRLVSEATRPLLPWSFRLETDALRPLPLLDQLYADKTRFATRSVANHLNDVSKIDPEAVIERLENWHREGKQDQKEMAWISHHALRTLSKKGDPAALALLGFQKDPEITLSPLTLSPPDGRIEAGDSLQFACEISARDDVKLIVDYIVDFVKANGGTAPKTYRLKQVTMKKGDVLKLSKAHRFLKDASTYRLYPGRHQIRLQINGKGYVPVPFDIS